MKVTRKYINIILSLLLFTACSNVAKAEEVGPLVDGISTVKEVYSNRSISVSEFEGTVFVIHKDGPILNVYEGLNLYDGDVVCVGDESSLVIDVDSDKHVYVEENTTFNLTALGKEGNTVTTINLDKGAVLCEINEKLKDGESFDVITANSTMSVRGTVFRVSKLTDENNENNFDMVEVYDGKVWSSIQSTDSEVTIEPGQCALIQNVENQDSSFVTADQIDEDFWSSTSTEFKINSVESSGSAVMQIPYNKIPSKVINKLIDMVDNGHELSLSKEELVEVSETVTKAETENTHTHTHRAGSLNDEICATYGHSIITINGVRKCSVCGQTFAEEYVETEQEKSNTQKLADAGIPTEITLPDFHIEFNGVYPYPVNPGSDVKEDNNADGNVETPPTREEVPVINEVPASVPVANEEPASAPVVNEQPAYVPAYITPTE